MGWHKADPVGPLCDGCIVDKERGLGALLMTANVIRELSEMPDDPASYDRQVIALITYARLYNKVESATWPIRRFRFREILDELDGQSLPPN
ncbi:MAG: hypothetical protein GY719_31055 [bacterium]|nr:hypothetical protein [bacterium]